MSQHFGILRWKLVKIWFLGQHLRCKAKISQILEEQDKTSQNFVLLGRNDSVSR